MNLQQIEQCYDVYVDLPSLDEHVSRQELSKAQIEVHTEAQYDEHTSREAQYDGHTSREAQYDEHLPSFSFVIRLGKKSIIRPDDSFRLDLANWHITRAFLTNLRPTILRELILDNNDIRRLPPLPSIELLQARNANIYFLPEYANNLKQLIVPNNSITKLPHYPKLEFLDIQNNWICDISYRIKIIIACNNPITGIISGDQVDLSGCPVMCLPKITHAKSSSIQNGKLTWQKKNKYSFNQPAEIYLNWNSRLFMFFKPAVFCRLRDFL